MLAIRLEGTNVEPWEFISSHCGKLFFLSFTNKYDVPTKTENSCCMYLTM